MLVISWVPFIKASPSFASRLIGVRLWLSSTYLHSVTCVWHVIYKLHYPTWHLPIQWPGSTSALHPSNPEQDGKEEQGRHWHQPGCNQ